MFETDQVPEAYLPKFAAQVNNWLGDMIRSGHIRGARKWATRLKKTVGSGQTDAGSYQLGERFVMLFLTEPKRLAVTSLDRDLSELVTPTGRRHYQIKQNGEAVAYARSLIDQQESLCQLFGTRLANNIQAAIEGLDAYETQAEFGAGRWRVRLMTIPTFHTHAFLIQKIENGEVAANGSYIYVISAPEWLRNLQERTMLDSKDFLLAFKGHKPILGVRQNNDQAKEQIKMAKKKQAKSESGDGGGNDAAKNVDDSGANKVSGLGKPLFASLIYPVTRDNSTGIGIGGGGGHVAGLGGPPEGVDPIFVMFTYPVPQKTKEDITNS